VSGIGCLEAAVMDCPAPLHTIEAGGQPKRFTVFQAAGRICGWSKLALPWNIFGFV